MKKKLTTVCLLAVALIALLCAAACARSDKSVIQAAIEEAQARTVRYRQTDAAFADALMDALPDSCVYDDEDGFLIVYRGKNYLYTDTLRESGGARTFYSTLQEAAAAHGAVGQTVYTLGYHTRQDGGCARYTVGESAAELSYPCGDAFLNYATAKSKVSLAQMGWQGEDIVKYQKQFEGFQSVNTLVFPRGEYPMYDTVRTERDHVNYFGIGAILYAADGFGGSANRTYDALWNVRRSWNGTNTVTGQTYSDLHFEMRQKTYNAQAGEIKGLHYLMQISYCRDIAFYNCSYLVPGGLYDGDLRQYVSDCFDCFTDWHNLTFDGCSFENYSYANAGGAIGFRDIYNTGCEDLLFTNNTVVSSVRDEGVALFAGLDKLLQPDAPLGKGYIKNCKLEHNVFKALEAAEGLAPRTMFLTVGYQLSPVYNISYLNNTFEGYCNSYFLHYCYCNGLTFKGNTVNLRQTGDTKRMTLIYHNDSPGASDIAVEDNVFNLLGENFNLNAAVMLSPYSDASELTFRGNIVNLSEGYAETVIAGNATVSGNTFNLNRVGSVYYRTCGEVGGNVYRIGRLEKSVFEFYNASVGHDLVVKNERIVAEVALSNLLMFNGTDILFHNHALLFEDVAFEIGKVERDYYYLAWSSENIKDTAVPITFRRCTFGAYEGHLEIPHGSMHMLTIEP